MDRIEVSSFIQYFNEKLRQTNGEGAGTFSGTGPKYPMAVVYLGEASAKVHGKVSSMLNRIWPPYKKELYYLGVRQDSSMFHISTDGKITSYEDSKLQADINYLFGTSTHFSSRDRMMVYFVLETTGISKGEEIQTWNDIMGWTMEQIKVEGQIPLLMVLLNEDFEHADEAKIVRNEIGEAVYGSSKAMTADSVYLISNRRNDNTIISDWYQCSRILADLIVLSNSFEGDITKQLYSKDVKTAGYALVEKPVDDIAQVVVSSIIQHLNQYRKKTDASEILNKENLPEKLGISREGSIIILDDYCEKELLMLLPTEEQLEYFPRNTDEDLMAVHQLSEREFNALTMNAWDAYLEKIIETAEKMIQEGTRQKEEWKKIYRLQLGQYFSADELITLAESEATVRKKFKNMSEYSMGHGVLDAAKNRLRYKLSSNDKMIDFFMNIIKEEGERGEQLIRTWNTLVSSLGQLFQIADSNLCKFYEKIVQRFFDERGPELGKRFNSIGSTEELELFMRECMDLMLQSNSIFREPFEEELQKRLEGTSGPEEDVKAYIRSRLTGDEVKTYLHVSFALETTDVSAILLKSGTDLHKSLIDKLPNTTYYYNTGSSDAAEALVVYQVEVSNLVS